MKNFLLIALGLFLSITTRASNLTIENLTRTGNQITFDLSWDNSWFYVSNGQFHGDLVYIFIKQAPNGGPSWSTAKISSGSATSGFNVTIPGDQLGVRINHTYANINATTTVTLNLTGLMGAYQDLKVMGLEMVNVPAGSYALGDGVSDRTYHRGDDPSESYIVDSEAIITRGSTADDFDGGVVSYTGDIAASFPKGYSQFYCMKYPVTQQQYVDFLNCLPRIAQDARTESDLSGTTVTNNFVMTNTSNPSFNNGISCDNNIGTGNITFFCDLDNDGIPNEDNDGQHRAINFVNNGDIYAYLDWAGLAPMTTLQYEKACRGPLDAVAYEYAWGSALENEDGTLLNEGTAQETFSNSGIDGGIMANSGRPYRVGLNAPTSNATRELSNASYYGIIDLSGNLVFGVIPIDENYTGEQGDGKLLMSGEADFMDINIRLQSKGGNNTLLIDRSRVSSFGGTSALYNDRNSTKSIRGIWYLEL